MKKTIVLLLFSTLVAFAQKKDTAPDFQKLDNLMFDADSIHIELPEVAILPKHKFGSRTDYHYYLWFQKKVFKAYPYAMMAQTRLDSLNVRLKRIKSKRKKRRYVKIVQRYVEKELTDQLKKMTRTEGRVLIKLVHRQTGETAFENIRELRSGWKAFWYNTTANLFELSLKDKYNPALVNEDFLIEDILQRAFMEDKLKEQKPKLDFNYKEIVLSNTREIDVEKYKQMFEKNRKRNNKK